MSVNVNFTAKDAGFTSTAQKINGSMKSMDAQVKEASKGISMSFASMAKAGAALAVGFGAIKLAGAAITSTIAQFGKALDLGGELNDLSSRTGETAGNLLLLQRAFTNAGVSADKVGPTVNRLQKFMEDAAAGGQMQVDTLNKLGLSYDMLAGKAPTEQMEILSKRIASIQDPGKRAAAAMEIFGRSAGEMLPLFTNFSEEIQKSKEQLGSLPGVMDKSNASFDAISDSLAAIKTKFMEFAAGLLDRLAPAIELTTHLLARLDAAAIGMKLGDIITGASAAMGGFSAALDAIKIGEFQLAFEVAWKSIKLQAADSINSIYANIVAAFEGAKTFIISMMGPESGMYNILMTTFKNLGRNIQLFIGQGLLKLLEGFREFLPNLADSVKDQLGDIRADLEGSSVYIRQQMKLIPGQFKEAAKASGDAFDSALTGARQLVSTTKLQLSLQAAMGKAEDARVKAMFEAAHDQLAAVQEQKQGMTELESVIASINGLEIEITNQKKVGNKEAVKQLEASKIYFEVLKQALEKGGNIQDATTAAAEAYARAMQSTEAAANRVTAELKEQLTVQQKMMQELEKAKGDKAEKGMFGRDKERFEDLLGRGRIKGAEAVARRVGEKEDLAQVRDAFAEGGRKSIRDIAKEQGVDVGGKSNRELTKVLKGMADDKAKKEQEINDPMGLGAQQNPIQERQEQKDNMLLKAVESINTLVEKLEKKLPQTALA